MLNNQKCILIVDDEKKIVLALKDFFSANYFSVLCAHDGEEALEIYYKNNHIIDIILLDIMMPKKDGLLVLKELKENLSPSPPVILLTAKGEEYDQLSGFHTGADDYVMKPFSSSLLLARVNALLRRVYKIKENEIKAGEIVINQEKRSVYIKEKELDLTRREYDLLLYLIKNKDITLSRENILNQVWGFDFEGSTRTVDTHIKQLRIKLNSYAFYIQTIHCIGYKLEV